MVKEIVTDYEALSVRSDEIDVRKDGEKLRSIILGIKDTIRSNNLLSLSAVQIGEAYRVLCMKFDKNDLKTFVNPIITEVKGFELSREICSSIPGKEYIRPRHSQVTVTYQTPLGKIESRKFMGLAARVMQHELDHLDGLLLSDIGMELSEDWDTATDDERAEVIKLYLDSLDIKAAEINSEIKSDPELAELSDAIDFIDKVKTGEVRFEKTPEGEDIANQLSELKATNKDNK